MYIYISMFQSYLYGIEIDIKKSINKQLISFNRTFMELKFANLKISSIVISFQSYLYGIEISIEESMQATMKVSIVPLWN